jgi:hypothetical protein
MNGMFITVESRRPSLVAQATWYAASYPQGLLPCQPLRFGRIRSV